MVVIFSAGGGGAAVHTGPYSISTGCSPLDDPYDDVIFFMGDVIREGIGPLLAVTWLAVAEAPGRVDRDDHWTGQWESGINIKPPAAVPTGIGR